MDIVSQMGETFEVANAMDMMIFGILIFTLFKLMERRTHLALASSRGSPGLPGEIFHQNQAARDRPDRHHINKPTGSGLSAGFDQTAFIDFARDCFVRLQKAWDEGDLADIRQFTTDYVFAEIQNQFHSRTDHCRTEIVSLDAELLSIGPAGDKQEAIVLFRSNMEEERQLHRVEEVWHFVRMIRNQHAVWCLHGIQQVEG